MRGQQQIFSSGKDDWQTPQDLFDAQHKLWNFTVDGAANDANHLLPAWWGYHGDELIDALDIGWSGERVWLNPPYSMCAQFMEKAHVEMLLSGALTVALVPARTDTKWFHAHVYKQCGVSFDLLKGRLKFRDPLNPSAKQQSAPFPSMLVLFDPRKL